LGLVVGRLFGFATGRDKMEMFVSGGIACRRETLPLSPYSATLHMG
jgi:hypothetical protein